MDKQLVLLYRSSLEAYDQGRYSEATQAYSSLLKGLKKVTYQNRLNKSKSIYEATKKKDRFEVKHKKYERLLPIMMAGMIMSSAVAPWALFHFIDFVNDDISEAYGKVKQQQTEYYRVSYLNFELDEGKLLNYLLSPVSQIDYFYKMGVAHVHLAENDKAIECYKNAISNLEQLRSSIELDRQKITFFTEKLNIYEQLIELLVANNNIQDAFFYIDRCKARSMADLVATKMLAKSSKDFASYSVANSMSKNRLLMDQAMIADYQVRSIQVVPSDETLSLKKISKLKSLVSVKPLTHQQLIQMISPATTVIELFYSNDSVIVVGFNQSNGYFVRQYPIQHEKLKLLINQHKSSIGYSTFDASLSLELSQKLYVILFDGIADKFTDHILIVPYGLFYNFPFATLHNKNNYMIEDISVSTLPSVSILPYMKRNQPHGKALFVGGIEYKNYLALPFTEVEINELSRRITHSQLLKGNRATKKRFMSKLDKFDIIHFAGHGYFDAADPLASGLVFSDIRENHLLTGYDLLGVDMRCTLMTLSACQTGQNVVLKQSETFGLQRALLISGVKTILSSLWQVDDHATMELMKGFYRHLEHQSIAKALASAQMDLLNKYPNPYYWAAFQISGYGDTIIFN